jgi:hypothetical protein
LVTGRVAGIAAEFAAHTGRDDLNGNKGRGRNRRRFWIQDLDIGEGGGVSVRRAKAHQCRFHGKTVGAGLDNAEAQRIGVLLQPGRKAEAEVGEPGNAAVSSEFVPDIADLHRAPNPLWRWILAKSDAAISRVGRILRTFASQTLQKQAKRPQTSRLRRERRACR